MAAADLGLLRTCKQGVDEGLIDQEHFDMIKLAWAKAQMIKAGLDAGFIREEDYMQARDSFLQSLDFKVHGPPAVVAMQPHPAPAPSHAPAAPAARSGGGGLRPDGASAFNQARTAGANLPSPVTQILGPAAAAAAAPAPTSAPAAPARAAPAPTAMAATRSDSNAPPPASNSGEAPGTVPIPTDLMRIGRPGIADGKTSMSGISVHEACINLFNHIKTKSAFKWVSYKIDDAGGELVVPDQLGSTDSSYEQFLATLPDNQSRFAVFDYAYSNNDTGQTNQKLVFIHWAPQAATTKNKMMYSSTKAFFKGFLEGVSTELQADSMSELQEEEVVARIAQGISRK